MSHVAHLHKLVAAHGQKQKVWRQARYRSGDWNEFQHAGSNKVYIYGFTLQTGSWKRSLTPSRNLLTSDGFLLRFCHDSCSFKCLRLKIHSLIRKHKTAITLATPHLRFKLKGMGSSSPMGVRGWGGGEGLGLGLGSGWGGGVQQNQQMADRKSSTL